MKPTVNTHDGIEKAIKLALKERNFNVTEPMQDLINRYQYCYDKRNILLKTQTVKLHQVRRTVVEALTRDFGISIKQAYSDYNLSEQILDNQPPLKKKELGYDELMAELRDDILLAQDNKDLKALGVFRKLQLEALKSYPDANIIDWANMEFSKIEARFDPSLIKSKVIESPQELQLLNEKMKEKYSRKSISDFININATDVTEIS